MIEFRSRSRVAHTPVAKLIADIAPNRLCDQDVAVCRDQLSPVEGVVRGGE